MKFRLPPPLTALCIGAALAGSVFADTFGEQLAEANEAQKRGEYVRAIVTFTTALLQAGTPDRQAAAFLGRGEAYWLNGEQERAINDWGEAIRFNPKNGAAYNNRGTAYFERGEYRKAFADYEKAAVFEPALGLNGLAWALATCPDASLRDGAKAVEHARKSCELTKWADWRFIDTLAAACAEAGDFRGAISYVKRALDMPAVGGADRAVLHAHLASFENSKPLREEPKR